MVDDSSSDDDLYAWFIDAMAEEYGAAEEVRPNVVHVWSVVDGKKDPRPYELHVNRSQLRSIAYSHINIFDDTQGDVRCPRATPSMLAWTPSPSIPRSPWTAVSLG